MLFNKAYYFLKPAIPWSVRIAVRRIWAAKRRAANSDVWPIEEAAGATPPNWPGWPDGRQFALVLTHDVEGLKGLRRIERLMAMERRLGFRSSFNLVPGDSYEVSDQLVRTLDQSGFEVGVHGLEHDGKLYSSKARFELKARKINSYAKRWGARGFRSPLMQHRLGWLHRLNIEYDSSTFDTDPFEPEPDGVRTIFPFWVPGPDGSGFVELPYTLAQDFTLFVVLRETSIKVWKDKLDWIAQRGGMAMLITHPDYMCFDEQKIGRDEARASLYEEFLTYVREKYGDRCWAALPRDVNKYYRDNVPAGTRNTRARICMIGHTNYASDNRIRRYSESLAARGDIVDVVALRSSELPQPYELKGVNVYGVQHRDNIETGKWSYAWQLLRFLYRSFVFVSRRHHKIRYDLIHTHNGPDFLVFAALYPKWTGAKIILDIHDVVPELFEGRFSSRAGSIYVKMLKILERLSAGFSDHVIVSNHLWQKRLIERSLSADKCSVLVNRIDPGVFYRRERTRADGKVVLLFPGSFQPHQGLCVAIKALARLKEKLPNCELHLCGGGGGRDSQRTLERLASELGLNGRVRFEREVPLDRIPQMMADADIGVVPKLADSFGNEAYSTRIMEFMSQGIPVVASRTAVDTYYFSDETVCFFKSGDDQAMADAVLKVIGDPGLRESLSLNGLDYAARNSWTLRKTEYLDLIDSLCVEKFELSDPAGNARRVPLAPRVSSRRTAVCIIDENLPVPQDTRVWKEARALTEAGYRVSVICPRGPGYELARETLEGVEIYRHSTFSGNGILGYLVEYAWALTAESFLALRVYAATRFQVLHACNPPDTIFLIALFFRPFGVRFVYDQHDPAPELYKFKFGKKGFFHWLALLAERLTCRTASAVIATNHSCREIALTRGGVSPARTFVVRGSPDLADFHLPGPKPELKQGRKHLVLYLGNMGSQDGVDLLLDSIEYLLMRKGRRDTLFVLIGPGPEQPRLKSDAAARGLEEWVKFTGGLYDDELRAWLATADVAVAPDPYNDFNDKLTMIKILEYQACGLPTVLYDLAEGRQAAGDSALFARNNDPIDFGDQIAVLLDSESLRRRLGANGRKRIESGLNWSVDKQNLLKAYETALGGA
jgi:glycosyltransferase involved in cell wall biosynthesis/peptidoglycan/xylan/chitin deacetylase (PgdA/CDA1 family)